MQHSDRGLERHIAALQCCIGESECSIGESECSIGESECSIGESECSIGEPECGNREHQYCIEEPQKATLSRVGVNPASLFIAWDAQAVSLAVLFLGITKIIV